MTATEGNFHGPRRTVTVNVDTEVVSLEQDVWCDACALPSAVRLTYAVTAGGRTTLAVKTVCENES